MTSSYNELHNLFARLSRFHHLSSIASWDMHTMMPIGGSKARSEAMAELNLLQHQLLTNQKTSQLLDQAEQETLGEVEQANLLEMRRHYNNAIQIPESLVEAKSLAGARCENAWRIQRHANDWAGFVENLREVVKLSREEATIRSKSSGLSPYDSLLNLFEPGMSSHELDTIFGDVKSWLPDLLQKVVTKQDKTSVILPKGPFSIEKQRALGIKVMNLLGFDFNAGRIDVSSHPFCGGVPEDVRITTRYNENNFINSLMAIIHETGHALYEQNLPREWLGQPISLARSTAIHESQSLLFERQLARNSDFLKILRLLIIEQLGEQPALEEDNFIMLIQRVKVGLIRVYADDVSYPAHVILRYEIEKSLIEGDIEVEDIPALWNEKMSSYLGLDTVGNYKDGCMQDIHWSCASFGYFPTYTLGAMYAAQLFHCLKRNVPNLSTDILQSDLSNLFNWLKNNIWSNGSRYTTDVLITKATGEKLNPRYFREHLENHYL
ncbi:MAG: carboxypeptidase M32 [Candidatus Liberibacter europaeus]|uniref:Metal-dependent carboxypeptidase n=1 Tax=Candidatus Liberibacter europaeus TaxID=744859 RepID=A0A2T4VXG4_9HYPH|nr:carboxypeptidase M32 [Candidatus Liberibacter europaeus]PTL86459.1 MAG: carboxypeptidase M32 [Candidatus Liberibacter europaeus]